MDKARFKSSHAQDDIGVSLANDMNKNTYEVKMDNKKVAFQLNESIF